MYWHESSIPLLMSSDRSSHYCPLGLIVKADIQHFLLFSIWIAALLVEPIRGGGGVWSNPEIYRIGSLFSVTIRFPVNFFYFQDSTFFVTDVL